MSKDSINLFGKTKSIENQIDNFLDKISEGGIYFEMGFNFYLDHGGINELCQEKLNQLRDLEDRCSALRRTIATELYTEMLIPDARGDVLSLLQDLFYLIDVLEDNFREFLIEQPQIPETNKQDFKELTKIVVNSLECVIAAARCYFRNPLEVRSHIHKISLYENESDKIATRLKTSIFNSDLPLANKMQLRDAVNVIDEMADNAEDVGDWLAIYTIKRAM